VIGAEEELSVACRTILDLVETCGYRFEEIAVVARTLEPYRSLVQAIFDRHRIPLVTAARRPLIHQPLCKTLLLLATLPLNDFYRAGVLDVVTSPFYAGALLPEGGRSPAYHPEQWKAVVDALNITHGIGEWKRLESCCKAAIELNGDDGPLGPLKIAPEVIALLWTTVSQLLTSCTALPVQGTYGTLLEAFQRLIKEHFRRPDGIHEDNSAGQVSPLAAQWAIIDQTLTSLSELNLLGPDLSWAEFVEVLTHAFERQGAPLQPAFQQGVRVMDAMAARGLPFKALFVLGLNEKVFPRYIREDAFLRDRHRRVLDATLGYKIDEKLMGFDEEALLFTLLSQSATRRLHLSFQRADDTGRLLAPSPYLTDARQRASLPLQSIEAVPRRLTERIAQRPTMCRFFSPADLGQWLAFNVQYPGYLFLVSVR
jgi:ATP-dependent helicase/nuclease subunit B